MRVEDFGASFHWGVSSAAFQTEGATVKDGKGLSIWDEFTQQKGKIYQGHHAREACDFYHRYPEDIHLLKQMGIKNFRFSVSWPRVLPTGTGSINHAGLDFYKKLIDQCLDQGVEPWMTAYHWDLPLALEYQGGWTNRDVVGWFGEYVQLLAKHLGDRVKYWMVLNEPMVFTGAGYFLGLHAPGRRGMRSFLSAIHHASLCQAEGAKILRAQCPAAEIGTTFSCSHIQPYRQTIHDLRAARRVDTLLNRLFIEPGLGMGYPQAALPALEKIDRYMHAGDEERMAFDFDFYGLQNYTRELIQYSLFMPYLNAKLIKASSRKVPTTLMDWEVYPESIYFILKDFYQRYRLKKIIITENGAAFRDEKVDGKIDDKQRKAYLQQYIHQCLRARREGVPLEGYFVWTLTDNFEWAEGYKPTFGMVHVDFNTQTRTIKGSGRWYSEFLAGKTTV